MYHPDLFSKIKGIDPLKYEQVENRFKAINSAYDLIKEAFPKSGSTHQNQAA